MQTELFACVGTQPLGPGAWLLRDFASEHQAELLDAIIACAAISPFRHLVTPGGQAMSVAMTNAGQLGWHSDRRGYRYERLDPLTGHAWPPLPQIVPEIGRAAALACGYPPLLADVCLINRYRPGARLSLHQDRDESDLAPPIVSISLGLPATFLFGGNTRTGSVQRVPLRSGDVAVWGGASRLAFHGIAPLPDGDHPLTGRWRYNLTLRRGA